MPIVQLVLGFPVKKIREIIKDGLISKRLKYNKEPSLIMRMVLSGQKIRIFY